MSHVDPRPVLDIPSRLLPKGGVALESLSSRVNSMGRVASCGLVMTILVGLSFLLDVDGSLGTDTGGKIATIDAMVERGDWSPTLGYWAEAVDPDGIAHPFFGTTRREAGWVNVTSLPMIMATKPLVELAGTRGMLAIPLLGSIFTCLLGGELGRRMGAISWKPGFWIAAGCSPVAVYGLDFWEHSIGLALMVGGVVAVLNVDAVSSHSVRWATTAGLCFGVAATMRTEALVFGFVAGLVCLSFRAKLRRRLARGAAMATAALVPLVANQVAEAAVYGDSLRSERTAAALGASGTTGLWQRLQEGVLITSSPINLVHPLSLATAVLVAVAVVWMGLALLQGTDLTRPATLCGLVVLLVFLRLVTFGPTFVPGMLAAVPAAGLGVAVGIVKRDRVMMALTIAPIPLVWATMYSGAAEAQWAGRYILTSGVVLAVYGAVHAARRCPRAVVGFVAANLVMTILGVTYLVNRTRDFGEANRSAAEIDGVVVFTQPFLAREGAPLGRDRQWLSAQTDEQRAMVVEILDHSDISRFTLISNPVEGKPTFAGFEHQPNPVELRYGSLTMIETAYVRNTD